jgi:Trk K+ transport system NAD-binding subunit
VADQLGTKPIYDALLDYDIQKKGFQKKETSDELIMIQMVIEPRSIMDGKQIKDLRLPDGCLLTTISRHGKEYIPKGKTRLRHGDNLTMLTNGDGKIVSELKAMTNAG